MYTKSESGWVDSELFLQWFKKIFLKYAVPERPLLLLVDGHKSHITLDLIDSARSNNITIFCLPPHCTHALQPLDVAVFKSLKAHFSRSLYAWCFTKRDFVVTKRDFARVVKEPFELAFNIKNGFEKCGIYPFNCTAFDKAKLLPSEMYSSGGGDTTSTISSSAHAGEAECSQSDSTVGPPPSTVSLPLSTVGPPPSTVPHLHPQRSLPHPQQLVLHLHPQLSLPLVIWDLLLHYSLLLTPAYVVPFQTHLSKLVQSGRHSRHIICSRGSIKTQEKGCQGKSSHRARIL